MLERSELAFIDPRLSIQAQNVGFRVKREQLYSHVIPGSIFFLLEISFELEGCFFPGILCSGNESSGAHR